MNKTDNNRLSTSNNANSIYNHKSETMSLVNFITKLKNSQIKSDKTSSSIPRKRKRKKKIHFLGKHTASEREKEVINKTGTLERNCRVKLRAVAKCLLFFFFFTEPCFLAEASKVFHLFPILPLLIFSN